MQPYTLQPWTICWLLLGWIISSSVIKRSTVENTQDKSFGVTHIQLKRAIIYVEGNYDLNIRGLVRTGLRVAAPLTEV